MGVGNFFGMLPEEMRNSRLYGVELDSISGRIAQDVYKRQVPRFRRVKNTHKDLMGRPDMPSHFFIPQVILGAGGGIRALGVNHHLLVEWVFIKAGGDVYKRQA